MPREKWRRCQANKTRGRVLICLLFAFSLIGTAGWLVGWNSLVRLLVKNTIAKMPVDVHGSAFAVNETEAGLMLVPRLVAVVIHPTTKMLLRIPSVKDAFTCRFSIKECPGKIKGPKSCLVLANAVAKMQVRSEIGRA